MSTFVAYVRSGRSIASYLAKEMIFKTINSKRKKVNTVLFNNKLAKDLLMAQQLLKKIWIYLYIGI